ncbi:hypothetical protein PFISCL1PPCAC_6653, partial [Pristionchus fissidentatus]
EKEKEEMERKLEQAQKELAEANEKIEEQRVASAFLVEANENMQKEIREAKGEQRGKGTEEEKKVGENMERLLYLEGHCVALNSAGMGLVDKIRKIKEETEREKKGAEVRMASLQKEVADACDKMKEMEESKLSVIDSYEKQNEEQVKEIEKMRKELVELSIVAAKCEELEREKREWTLDAANRSRLQEEYEKMKKEMEGKTSSRLQQLQQLQEIVRENETMRQEKERLAKINDDQSIELKTANARIEYLEITILGVARRQREEAERRVAERAAAAAEGTAAAGDGEPVEKKRKRESLCEAESQTDVTVIDIRSFTDASTVTDPLMTTVTVKESAEEETESKEEMEKRFNQLAAENLQLKSMIDRWTGNWTNENENGEEQEKKESRTCDYHNIRPVAIDRYDYRIRCLVYRILGVSRHDFRTCSDSVETHKIVRSFTQRSVESARLLIHRVINSQDVTVRRSY